MKFRTSKPWYGFPVTTADGVTSLQFVGQQTQFEGTLLEEQDGVLKIIVTKGVDGEIVNEWDPPLTFTWLQECTEVLDGKA